MQPALPLPALQGATSCHRLCETEAAEFPLFKLFFVRETSAQRNPWLERRHHGREPLKVK
jgi:hypothetical protein